MKRRIINRDAWIFLKANECMTCVAHLMILPGQPGIAYFDC